jgi:hypothetical protein
MSAVAAGRSADSGSPPGPRPDTCVRGLDRGVSFLVIIARRERGMTKARAARLARISTRMLSMLEHVDRRQSTAVAGELVHLYGLDGTDLDQLLAEALRDVGKDSPYKRAKQLQRP